MEESPSALRPAAHPERPLDSRSDGDHGEDRS
jgi:hypothetical protein